MTRLYIFSIKSTQNFKVEQTLIKYDIEDLMYLKINEKNIFIILSNFFIEKMFSK
jgi:hypothetical protein